MPQRAPRVQRTMHIVVAGWMFVTFTMALTMSSAWAGLAFFAVVGLGPVALLVALAVRRRRGSVPQQHVHTADDGDAKADQ